MKKITPLENPLELTASLTQLNRETAAIEQWQQLTQGQYSHNTLLSFRNDWATFLEFCHRHKKTALPADVETVTIFIHEISKTRKMASVKRYIVTMSLLHRIHQLTDPTRHREVRYQLNRLYVEKSADAAQATPFHLSHLEALYLRFACSEKLKDIRDLLIWSLSFEAMLKRSELTAITICDLEKREKCYWLHINQHQLELSELTSELIDYWLSLTALTTGPLLRRINKHQHIGTQAMDHSSIYRVFRRAATELGVAHEFTFSGQSARVGAAKDLAAIGKNLREIQAQGRWKSPAMPAQYLGYHQTSQDAMAKFRRKIEKE